ncbi:hypothetical protein I317_03660 [Kwoniella heveanensis CBS 569]|nr:hypothetical protein I317_03660 [Kwoniella heveanensis CBS 569]
MSTSSLPEPPFPAPDAYCDIAEDEAVKAVKAGRAKHEEEVVEWEDDQEQEHKSRSTDFGHACGHGHRNEHGQIWEKVLWRRQPFPDNYVPSDFLSELKRLPPRPTPGVLPLFFAALPISLHLSTIAIFLSIFYNLLHEIMSPEQVGFGCVIFGMGGWGIYKLGWGLAEYRKNATDRGPIIPAPTPLRSVILPPLLLSLLSPVLGTLTSATTSDSIWPLAAGLGLVHLLLADFRTGEDLRLRRRRDRARRLNAEVDSAQRQDAAVFSSPTVTLTGAESKGKGRSRRGSVVLHEIEQEKRRVVNR